MRRSVWLAICAASVLNIGVAAWHLLSQRSVQMLVESSGESLSMQVVAEFKHGDKAYAVLTSTTTLVSVILDEGDALHELEVDEFDKVAGLINGALRGSGLWIETHANEFLLAGKTQEDQLCRSYDSFEDPDTGDVYFIVADVVSDDSTFIVAFVSVPRLFPAELVDYETARSLSDGEMIELRGVFQDVVDALDGAPVSSARRPVGCEG